jgi:NYN domain-containing protein
MIKSVIVFVDGENLTLRYQEMLAAGREPLPDVKHIKDSFVWASPITEWSALDVIRVLYYTSVVGDDVRVAEVSAQIGATVFRVRAGGVIGTAQIIPRVHKKLASSRKTKVVDVDVTIDVMRAALTMPIGGIFVLSGDGDYFQLVQEVIRSSKQVYVGAFSSGLAAKLKTNVEAFLDLDTFFFKPTR